MCWVFSSEGRFNSFMINGTFSNKYVMHNLDGKMFNNVKKTLQTWRRHGRTGATSLTATGKCMRSCVGTKSKEYFEATSTVSSLFFISTKSGIWCLHVRLPLWRLVRFLILIAITNTLSTYPSPHLQSIFYPVCSRHLYGWNHVTRHKYPQSMYVCI